MNLGSAVQEQEDLSPGLQPEQHELPPLPASRKKHNLCGCCVHCCLIAVFFGLVCCCVTSVALFVIGNNRIPQIQTFQNSSSGCVLHASKDDHNSPQLGEVWWCYFVIWTMAAVAIISAIMFFVAICCTICSLSIGVSA